MEKPNHRVHIKIIAQVLNKMAKFFNDMSEDCLEYLVHEQQVKVSNQAIISKEQTRNQQNKKRLAQISKKSKKDQVAVTPQNLIQKAKMQKPKHPMSSFFFYYKQKGQQIAKEKGESLGSKLAKIVAQLWKKVPEKDREPYEALARKSRENYEQNMAQYRLKYGKQIDQIKKTKKETKVSKKSKENQSNITQLKQNIQPKKEQKIQKQLPKSSEKSSQSSLKDSQNIQELCKQLQQENLALLNVTQQAQTTLRNVKYQEQQQINEKNKNSESKQSSSESWQQLNADLINKSNEPNINIKEQNIIQSMKQQQ